MTYWMQGNGDLGNKLASTTKSTNEHTHYIASGYAFGLYDILYNFPIKKLKTVKADREKVSLKHKKMFFVLPIFAYAVDIVLRDVVENDSCFHFPLVSTAKAVLKVNIYRGENATKLRKLGILADIDILKTFLTLPMALVVITNKGKLKVVNISYKKELKNTLIEKANSGFQYCGRTDTYIKDYYEKMHDKFPSAHPDDIKLILRYGFHAIAQHLMYDGDIIITHKHITVFFGTLPKTEENLLRYYSKKLYIKLAVMANKKQIPYDGYYYLALPKVLQEKIAKGEIIHNIYLYRYFELCDVANYKCKYIYRIPLDDFKFIRMKWRRLHSTPEFYMERPLLTLKTMGVFTRKYKILEFKVPLAVKDKRNEEKEHDKYISRRAGDGLQSTDTAAEYTI